MREGGREGDGGKEGGRSGGRGQEGREVRRSGGQEGERSGEKEERREGGKEGRREKIDMSQLCVVRTYALVDYIECYAYNKVHTIYILTCRPLSFSVHQICSAILVPTPG